jgi:hypothetical protein
MDLQKFDSTLKSALENIEVPFDPSTWAALEGRLDRIPAPDAVDKALRPALERIETPYDPGSWASLANRMDGLARVRRMRMTKLAELAIFLLLLLNLKGFFGIVESVTAPAPPKKEVIEPIASKKTHKSKKQNSATDAEAENVASINASSLTAQVLNFVQNVAASLTNSESNDPELVSVTQPMASNASVLDAANFYQQNGFSKFQIDPTLPSNPTPAVNFAALPIFIPGVQTNVSPKQNHFYAASYVSLDRNFIQEGAYKNQHNGYGGGFAVGYRKGKWGFESGIHYAQKSYQPNKIKEEYQNDPVAGVSFFYTDQVDAEVFSLPVKATRRIAKVGKGSAHAIAGVTAHFAATKDYSYQTEHKPPVGQSGNPADHEYPAFPDGKGVLEKGGLQQNAYATADLGLRMEHPVGKRYIAFVEPVYRQSLGGGLGPKSAKLSTFSIQAGVMASL